MYFRLGCLVVFVGVVLRRPYDSASPKASLEGAGTGGIFHDETGTKVLSASRTHPCQPSLRAPEPHVGFRSCSGGVAVVNLENYPRRTEKPEATLAWLVVQGRRTFPCPTASDAHLDRRTPASAKRFGHRGEVARCTAQAPRSIVQAFDAGHSLAGSAFPGGVAGAAFDRASNHVAFVTMLAVGQRERYQLMVS